MEAELPAVTTGHPTRGPGRAAAWGPTSNDRENQVIFYGFLYGLCCGMLWLTLVFHMWLIHVNNIPWLCSMVSYGFSIG